MSTAAAGPESSIEAHAAAVLRQHGYAVGRVWGVLSAGDSGRGCDEIVYTTPGKDLRTALVRFEGGARKLEIEEGW